MYKNIPMRIREKHANALREVALKLVGVKVVSWNRLYLEEISVRGIPVNQHTPSNTVENIAGDVAITRLNAIADEILGISEKE